MLCLRISRKPALDPVRRQLLERVDAESDMFLLQLPSEIPLLKDVVIRKTDSPAEVSTNNQLSHM